MSREVTREQFEVTGDNSITHVPSGTRLTKLPGNDLDELHVEYLGSAGEDMKSNGEEYDGDTIRALAEEILRDVRQRDH
jgi:hypothetical protein